MCAGAAPVWVRHIMRAPGLSQLVTFVGFAAWRTGRGFSTGVPAAARDRRIRKIEKGLRCLDVSIRSIDAEMMEKGFEVGALLKLQAQRDAASAKIEALINEREQLEANFGGRTADETLGAYISNKTALFIEMHIKLMINCKACQMTVDKVCSTG
jgi:hypothetical protein